MSSLFGAFLRPVGAAVDVKELEYVSAIHQTGKEIDEDGFITAQDVQVFLRSRFGAVITKEDAIDIVRGLAGSTRLPLPKAANDTNCNSATTRSFLSFSRGEDKEKEKQKINVEHKQPIIETGMSSGDNIEVPLKDPTSGEQNNLKKNDKSDQNDEEHYAEALQDVSDVRRQWKFQKDVPKKKDKTLKETELLVRYDIVQLLTILYIPTLLRLKHHRLDRSVPFASASFYGAQCCIKYLIPSKWVSRFVQRKENTYKAMKQKLLPKPQNLMEDVLNILLEKMQDDSELRASLDNTASIMGNDNKSGLPKLSKRIFVSEKLVQSMLVCIGEEKSARDEQLVKQMVEAVGGEGSVFNELSFARALTDDVEAWPIESEDNLTTSFYDVYGFDENECLMHKEENKTIEEEQGEEGQETAADLEVEASQKSPRSRVPNYKNTLSFIDYAADAYQSNAFVVFLFTFYTISAIFIVLVLNDQILVGSCDDGGFWCLLGRTVFDWLVFALTLIASGFIILYPISLGNNAHSQRIYPNLLSIVLLVLYIAVSRAGLDELVKNGEDHFEGSTHWYMTILWTAMTIAAVLTLVSLVKNLIPKLLPNKLKQNMLLKSFLLSSNTLRTAKQKKAATNKINLMIQNAYELHVDAHKSASGANAEHQTILNFVVNGEKPVKCGGLIWTWKAMFQKTMFEVEGVWLHARLLIAQAMQIIISIIIGVVWYEGTFSLADQVEHDREEAEEKGNTYALYFIPTRAAIVYPFMIGGIITLTFACLLILVYIPTTSAMVLKFRSGVLPSLHDPSKKNCCNIALHCSLSMISNDSICPLFPLF